MVEPSNFTLYTPHDPPLYKQTQFPPMPGGTGPQGRGTRGTCARRSQFGGPIVQNEPNLPAAARGTRPGGVGHGANMQNEPNFRRPWAGRGRQGRGTGTNCAKRTQFPAGPGGTRPPGAWDAGAKSAKRSQSPPRKMSGGTPNPRRAEGQSCKTNPISAGGRWDGARGRGTRGKCAKRSQFPATPGGTGLQGAWDRANYAKRRDYSKHTGFMMQRYAWIAVFLSAGGILCMDTRNTGPFYGTP
jgi:hypothetical protein